jgi:hypothetical protein
MNQILRFFPEIVNPVDGLYARVVHGSMHRFSFATGAGVSGHQVEKMLRTYGIRIWGREMENPEERAFLVKQSQAKWAEYLLCRAGVPLTCPLLDPRNAQYAWDHAGQPMPEPWDKKGIGAHSLVDRVVDLLARLG